MTKTSLKSALEEEEGGWNNEEEGLYQSEGPFSLAFRRWPLEKGAKEEGRKLYPPRPMFLFAQVAAEAKTTVGKRT